jgi:exodeoxyribonuclease V alpha subunit
MGAVLGDIRRAASGPKSAARAQALAAVSVKLAAEEVSADPRPVLADSLVTLEYTWRYAADSGIGRLASAINAGDATAALEVLDGGAIDAVRIDVPEGAGWRSLFALLRKRVVAGYRAVVTERDPAAALSALRRFRVLCAHRKGLRGVETLNRRIEEWLEAEGLLRADEVNYAGRPILVGRNDNRCGLFNGDVGILLPDSARPGIIRAWFDGPDGTVRSFRPAMLPEHATVFATTVHKSQGSEYEEVLLVLPEQPSPLLTRELLYTAVTRATTRVTVLGSRARVIEAVERPVWRMSGWG